MSFRGSFPLLLLVGYLTFLNINLSEPANCGVPFIKPVVYGTVLNRVINGQNAVEGSWPWIVSIRQILDDGTLYHICGGSLIDLDLVLTAAHCLVDQNIYSIVIVVDTYNVTIQPDIFNIYSVKSFKIHSNYDNSAIQEAFDIALIRLTETVLLSNTVGLVCLPGPNETQVVYNKIVYGIGW